LWGQSQHQSTSESEAVASSSQVGIAGAGLDGAGRKDNRDVQEYELMWVEDVGD